MKDEEAIDWKERFPTFHWTRRTSSRRGDKKLTKENGFFMCVFLRRRRRMSVWEILSSYVWKSVVHKKKCVRRKTVKGNYV
jgi:hypothetical protein